MNNERITICTDGSAITGKHSAFDSAAAFAMYANGELIAKKGELLRDHTNNYAEMYAVYMATKYCLENISKIPPFKQILIVTDSELTKKSLTEWMMGWLKKTKNELLINSAGVPVKNQELIKSTFINILMLQLKFDVYVCHINSHNTEKDKKNMYEKFIKSFKVDYDEFELIFEGNDICDKLAKNVLGIK